MNDVVEFYRQMLRIRMVEEQLIKLKDLGEIPGSMHLCIGQEAIPVGVSAHLTADDYVVATYRGHGWAISRGTSPAAIFAEIMGRDSVLNGGRAGSPYFSDARNNFLGENSIVGAGVPIAAGAALTASRRSDRRVAVVSIGDGATNQGAVHEALNMAAVLALPLVLIIENNLYSEMVRIKDMAKVDRLAVRGAAYGIPASTIDGNDPEIVAAAAESAIARAREGGGPTIIEAMTQRLVGHYTGDSQHYRPAGEVATASEDEPLVRLLARSMNDPSLAAKFQAIRTEIGQEIDEAVEEARRTPFPHASTAKDHLYA